MDFQSPKTVFAFVSAVYASCIYHLHIWLNDVQPTPFIDEIFHVPQAKAYCDGNFSHWDPKITTLPGLYLFSVGLNGIKGFFTGNYDCNASSLRLTNVICGMLILPAIYLHMKHLHNQKVDSMKLILASVNLSLFPVLHWFNYFYYTDVLSTLLVLVMLLLHVYHELKLAAFMGFLAVLTRQTNILWVCFALALQIADLLKLHNLSMNKKSFRDLVTKVTSFSRVMQTVKKCWTYLLLIGLFIAFIFVNGSIVVGDKDVHAATLNTPQILYFLLNVSIFSWSYMIINLRPAMKFVMNHPISVVLTAICFAVMVYFNTVVHPYLLADNRHYVFYMWNRFYGKIPMFRYLVIPVYLLGAFVTCKFLERRSLIFALVYAICSFLPLVLQKLLEPRYFIIPFVLLRLQFVSNSWKVLVAEFLFYLFINVTTVFVFETKTFLWADLEEPQRIMW